MPYKEPTEYEIDTAMIQNAAVMMTVKMVEARQKGKHGWHNEDLCSEQRLFNRLYDALLEARYVDVLNYAGMLLYRQERNKFDKKD